MLIGIDASRANIRHKTGPGWYSYYLIRELARIDDKNEYCLYVQDELCPALMDLNPAGKRDEGAAGAKKDKKGFYQISCPHGNFKAKVLGWPFTFFWTLGRLSFEMVLKRPDLLFVPAHGLPLVHPARIVLTVHDVGFERDILFSRRDRVGPKQGSARFFLDLLARLATWNKYTANSLDYLSWSTAFGLKHASVVIVPSRFTKREALEIYSPRKDNVAVVPNGCDHMLYHPIEENTATEKKLKKYDINRPFILSVGRIERKKNITALVEAFGILKERKRDLKHSLVLAGDAGFGFDEVKYMMHEYNIESSIKMPGWIEEEDLPYIYNSADAFIFPSKYEGFGIPLVEAMASGLPSAAANAASIPEVAGNAALLFDPGDVYAIADSIERLISDPVLRESLRLKGLERAARYSWEKCARETLAIFERI